MLKIWFLQEIRNSGGGRGKKGERYQNIIEEYEIAVFLFLVIGIEQHIALLNNIPILIQEVKFLFKKKQKKELHKNNFKKREYYTLPLSTNIFWSSNICWTLLSCSARVSIKSTTPLRWASASLRLSCSGWSGGVFFIRFCENGEVVNYKKKTNKQGWPTSRNKGYLQIRCMGRIRKDSMPSFLHWGIRRHSWVIITKN